MTVIRRPSIHINTNGRNASPTLPQATDNASPSLGSPVCFFARRSSCQDASPALPVTDRLAVNPHLKYCASDSFVKQNFIQVVGCCATIPVKPHAVREAIGSNRRRELDKKNRRCGEMSTHDFFLNVFESAVSRIPSTHNGHAYCGLARLCLLDSSKQADIHSRRHG